MTFLKGEIETCLQIILSLLKEKVAKQPLGAEDLAAAATVAVGAEHVPKVGIAEHRTAVNSCTAQSYTCTARSLFQAACAALRDKVL